MKKTISSLLLSAILLCAAFLVTKHISANPQSMSMEAQYVPNEVLIKFRENITDVASLRTVISLVQGKVVNYL
jgi:hypothetical protein